MKQYIRCSFSNESVYMHICVFDAIGKCAEKLVDAISFVIKNGYSILFRYNIRLDYFHSFISSSFFDCNIYSSSTFANCWNVYRIIVCFVLLCMFGILICCCFFFKYFIVIILIIEIDFAFLNCKLLILYHFFIFASFCEFSV